MNRTSMKQWMRALPDDVPLELLSIPGTHNSPACHRALPSVRCQIVSPLQQLERGVRFLDVRLQVDRPKVATSDSLSLVHSLFPVRLYGTRKFRSLYDDILAFLQDNPSETVIMSLKREGRGHGSDEDLAQKLHDHYISDKHWITEPGIPTLGEARSKIVLLRRFALRGEMRLAYSRARGIDAQVWMDNCANMSAGDVCVQDFYGILHTNNVARKIQYIHEQFQRANALTPSMECTSQRLPLVLNFLSASNFWRKGCWPDQIAAKINPAITRHLCEMRERGLQRGVGIMVMDWVGEDGNWDLVNVIVAMNEELFKLLDTR